MKTNKKANSLSEDNLVTQVMFRFFPYWPLFLGMLICSICGYFLYIRYSTPKYGIYATMLIKDEKKGLDDSKIMEALNLEPNSIVENEIELLHSRGLVNNVVKKLNLYAPVYTDGYIHAVLAYTTSPIVVQAKYPDSIRTVDNAPKIYFSYNPKSRSVNIENTNYGLDEWVNTPYGILKFSSNPNLKTTDPKPLYFYLISPKEITNSILENLQVTAPNKQSTIVKLTLIEENPKRGEDILNQLINLYRQDAVADKNEFSTKTIDVLSDRLSVVQRKIDSIQALINEYKAKNGIVNLSEQSTLFLQSIGTNDQKVQDINMQLAVLDEVENYAKSKDHDAGVVPSNLGVNDPVLSNLLQKLYDLEISYQRLKMTATENNPAIVSLLNDIQKTKASILENTRIQRITLNTQSGNLDSTGEAYASTLRNIPDKEKELVEISRQLAVLTSTYDFLLQKKEEASLSSASTVANSRTVDLAESSPKPVSPQKAIVFLIAVALALGLSALFVYSKEVFSPKILFRSDIDRYTDIPVFAEILDTSKKFFQRKLTAKQKSIIIKEQFNHLAVSIGLYSKNNIRTKVLVTSSITGEGKSFISTNLALTLAAAGKKVILLDLDFRNPQLTNTFKISNEPGVFNFLEGEIDPFEIIRNTEYNNLFVAGAGLVQLEKTSELLLNGKLAELFAYLEGVFDLIIVDTPPVEPISDAYILSKFCDKTIYVARHGYTPKRIIRLLDKNNKLSFLKNVCIVFNAVKSRGFTKQTYGYGYDTRYSYEYNQRRKIKA